MNKSTKRGANAGAGVCDTLTKQAALLLPSECSAAIPSSRPKQLQLLSAWGARQKLVGSVLVAECPLIQLVDVSQALPQSTQELTVPRLSPLNQSGGS